VFQNKVADIDMTVSPSSKTYSNIYNELNKYLTANSDIKKMDETAKESRVQYIL
jgi:peptidyl-prolyl cis-trans isomerase D